MGYSYILAEQHFEVVNNWVTYCFVSKVEHFSWPGVYKLPEGWKDFFPLKINIVFQKRIFQTSASSNFLSVCPTYNKAFKSLSDLQQVHGLTSQYLENISVYDCQISTIHTCMHT